MTDNASILLVDDEENLRRTLGMILQYEGYTISTAANIAEARACLFTNHFDLVFLDLKLPDGNGLTLLPEIRSQYPDTCVLILTAHDKLDDAIEAVSNGASDYLLKPIDPVVLIARVKQVLSDHISS
jgi:DNA-binding response OmpR family regulator